ncbi:ABC transporter permease [Edaphobacter modestus]|uniref:Putative permease n=1 Tax=Edaphobacter modestus TaxID=388466 RepID=A0A4Q7Z179_9BACT|nr:ABC transporter permease [Edaphobacter modestus]RZU43249.1 putative permease [Edaphobacter modestus]
MTLLRRIAALFRRSSIDHEIEEELQAHLAMRAEDNIAAGMPPAAAALDARLRFGNPTATRERVEHVDVALSLDSMWRDIHYAVRGYRNAPMFAIVAITTLALGIGANTAIFQLLNEVRLRSLPIAHPEELVDIRIIGGNHGLGINDGSYTRITRPVWQEIERNHDPLSGVFAWRSSFQNMQTGLTANDVRPVRALNVSADFFNVLGVAPFAGRLLGPEDASSACTSSNAAVSYSWWESQMGGRPISNAESIVLDGTQYHIVGVTPPRFFGLAVGEGFDFVTPLCTPPNVQREHFDIGVMGRLAPGWTLERATQWFTSSSKAFFEAALPQGYSTQSTQLFRDFKLGAFSAVTGVSNLRDAYDSSLWILLGITGLVLLIACANLANLMLARASARQRELAVRMALGATRARLLRQLLIESSLLAVTGALLGIVLAQLFSRLLIRALTTGNDSLTLAVHTDWRVLLFATAVAVFTCVVFGTLPAFRASKADPIHALKSGDGHASSRRERFSMQRIMVVTQVAISMVLLVAALLFVRSFRNLMTVDPGMREQGITVALLNFFNAKIEPAHLGEFRRQLLNEVRAMPGVTNAAITTMIPLIGGSWGHGIDVGPKEGNSRFTWVSPTYFQTMGIPILSGRGFNDNDTQSSPRIAIVNQSFVRNYLDGQNPIGKTVRSKAEPRYPSTLFEIVGVIPDTKYNDLRGNPEPMAFVPAMQFPIEADGPGLGMVISSTLPSAVISEDIKRALAASHPEIRTRFFELQVAIRNNLLRERLLAILSGFFGILAAVLVMVGLYGVVAYLVTRRRNELGIRIALGSTRQQIISLVMRDAGRMLAIGTVVGAIVSLLATRGAGSILFGLKSWDPTSLGFAITLLAIVAVIASFLPALRAARLDPVEALRRE